MDLEEAIADLADKEIILMNRENLKNVLLKNYGLITDKNDINVNYSYYCMKLEEKGLVTINVSRIDSTTTGNGSPEEPLL